MKRAAVLAALVLAACADATEDAATDDALDSAAAAPQQDLPMIGGDTIEVSFVNADGADAGMARLVAEGSGVSFAVRITGLTPGEHGFHLHEVGQCQAPGFESAGGHYNPHTRQHGLENPQGPHAGDLPNLVANDLGVADTSFTVDRITLMGGDAPLIKREGVALVVHAAADDYRTDPSGNSGDRVACAVVMR